MTQHTDSTAPEVTEKVSSTGYDAPPTVPSAYPGPDEGGFDGLDQLEPLDDSPGPGYGDTPFVRESPVEEWRPPGQPEPTTRWWQFWRRARARRPLT